MLAKLRNEPGLSEHEKILWARSLAATPDERWQMHQNFLRSLGLFTRSERKNCGFKSPNDVMQLPLLQQRLKRRAK